MPVRMAIIKKVYRDFPDGPAVKNLPVYKTAKETLMYRTVLWTL